MCSSDLERLPLAALHVGQVKELPPDKGRIGGDVRALLLDVLHSALPFHFSPLAGWPFLFCILYFITGSHALQGRPGFFPGPLAFPAPLCYNAFCRLF